MCKKITHCRVKKYYELKLWKRLDEIAIISHVCPFPKSVWNGSQKDHTTCSAETGVFPNRQTINDPFFAFFFISLPSTNRYNKMDDWYEMLDSKERKKGGDTCGRK